MAGARPHRPWPRQRATAITSQRSGSGRSSLPPQGLSLISGQSWQGLWSPAGHSPQPVPGPPSSHADLRPAELEGPMEKPKIHVLPHSLPEDHDSANSSLNGPTKGHSLTVGCLWEGPGTNQWLSRTTNGHSLTVGCLWEGHSTNQWLSRTSNDH